jgi:hypothetical protein
MVGVRMQPKQGPNLACLVRKGYAIRMAITKHPSPKIKQVIHLLLYDDDAKGKAHEFHKLLAKWDGPRLATELLYEKFGDKSC